MTYKPRVYTTQEVKDMFLKQVIHTVRYWENHPTSKHRVQGAVFSVLSLIDGSCVAMPGFSLQPNPHPADQDFLKDAGENWFPQEGDIAGGLHEVFYVHYDHVPETSSKEEPRIIALMRENQQLRERLWEAWASAGPEGTPPAPQGGKERA